MAEYKFDGKDLRDRRGRKIAVFDGKIIRDDRGRRVGTHGWKDLQG